MNLDALQRHGQNVHDKSEPSFGVAHIFSHFRNMIQGKENHRLLTARYDS